ncbi:hypothetical protein K7X08_007956 [Anisodus acutangulus]|uniref:Phosphomannomutase n=1 Tax=Anisodus acutangulus TaxID=402998 RepID=A0A9Q1MPP6_9SOLA|nr:hypothetical protein K7X08_007956 [Anisodus acutangulus]
MAASSSSRLVRVVGRSLFSGLCNNADGLVRSTHEMMSNNLLFQQQRTFIQMRTSLKVVDNSGAKRVACIQALKGKKGARLGDTIVCSVKEAQPGGKVKKGEVHYGVVVRAAMPRGRCDGSEVKFDDNAVYCILVRIHKGPIWQVNNAGIAGVNADADAVRAKQESSGISNRRAQTLISRRQLEDCSIIQRLDTSGAEKVVTVGVVGGSDLVKISEQLGKTVTQDYDYVFSENGKLIGTQCFLLKVMHLCLCSLKSFLGDAKLKEFINFTLHYIADLDIPIKSRCLFSKGTFIEFRSGMLNVSPIGRNCSQEERDEFEKYDKVHKIRETMITVLRKKFAHLNLTFSIGGQISFDVFPQGWDKTYCLRYLDEFNEIHFFGDKTYKGGNDYEIFESERTLSHTVTSPADTVTSPADTVKQCSILFLGKDNVRSHFSYICVVVCQF